MLHSQSAVHVTAMQQFSLQHIMQLRIYCPCETPCYSPLSTSTTNHGSHSTDSATLTKVKDAIFATVNATPTLQSMLQLAYCSQRCTYDTTHATVSATPILQSMLELAFYSPNSSTDTFIYCYYSESEVEAGH